MCVLLLVGAGLFSRSLYTVVSQDVGLDLDRIVQVRLPALPSQSLDAVDARYAMVADVLRRLPHVESVVVSRASAPLSMSVGVSTRPQGWDLTDLKGRAMPALLGIDERYLSTLGMRLINGRGFTTEEVRDGSPVLVANRAFGDEFYAGVDPVGQCVIVGSGSCVTIIGLVENSLFYSRTEVAYSQIFLPASHPAVRRHAPSALMVRTTGSASEVVPAIRAAVQDATDDMPFVPVETLGALTEPQLQPWRLGMTMFLLFGSVALVVALVGVYSAVAHAAAQRTHEIGVRIALGATRAQVVVHLGRRAAVVIVAGLAVGLVLAIGFSPLERFRLGRSAFGADGL